MEEESFTPFTSNHGNVNGEISHLRNVFLSAEKEYFLELLSEEHIRNYFTSLLAIPPDLLYREAKFKIDLIESGRIDEIELEIQEGIITLMLAAIQDKAKMLELVKTYENDQGRVR